MATARGDSISVVLPTYNRAEALRRNLGTVLALNGVDEVVVVVDGSFDATDAVLAQFDDPRLRVVRHSCNRGVAAARNTGIDSTRGAWVLFGEDDCRFPADYGVVLRGEAERHGAALVGAPLLFVPGDDDEAHRAAAKAPRVERLSTEDVAVFPRRAVETPFVPARVLVCRSVLEEVRFDEQFAVNSYREETDFFVRVARSGYRCLYTPATYCWQLAAWRGGNHEARGLRYEYWALRNNWRFLHRHGKWLSEHGYIASPSLAQASFARRRATALISGTLHTRFARFRRRAVASPAREGNESSRASA